MSSEQKQDVLNDVTDLLGLSRWVIKRPGVKDGSSLPSHVFRAAAIQAGVEYVSMPAANEQVVRAAGLPFKPTYDSRGTGSKGGGTVTLEGLKALRAALEILLGPLNARSGFLLTWNPAKWEWAPEKLAATIDATAAGQIVEGSWAVGSRTSGIGPGDRAFLLRQGTAGRGIVASGTIRSHVFRDAHYTDRDRSSNFVRVDWEVVLHPDDALPIETLRAAISVAHEWSPQGSGTTLPEPALGQLEQLWLQHLAARRKAGSSPSGQARQLDALRRRAVEEAAQNWLVKVYEDGGWLVEDTHIGNPFDARATKDGRTVYLEAKGTQTEGESVIVTRNEIAHAKAHPGSCVIGIWSGIRFTKAGRVDAKSGSKKILRWNPAKRDLDPLAYDWTVGGLPAEP